MNIIPFVIRNNIKRSGLWLFERLGLMAAEPYFFTYRQFYDGRGIAGGKTPAEVIRMSLDEIADSSDIQWKLHYFRTRWHPKVAPYIFGLTPSKASVTYDTNKGADFHYEVDPVRAGTKVTVYSEKSFSDIEAIDLSINGSEVVEALSVCGGTVQIGLKVVKNGVKHQRNKTIATFWFCDPKDAMLFKMRMA